MSTKYVMMLHTMPPPLSIAREFMFPTSSLAIAASSFLFCSSRNSPRPVDCNRQSNNNKTQYLTFETHLKSNQKRRSFHSFVGRGLMSPEHNRLYSSSPAPSVISWRVGFAERELHFEDFECFEQSTDISLCISCSHRQTV